ncbi:MAG: NifU family protein [Candidatus Omnitrophica bacterium]|nr:NifU family protein [Candidatus Omnitrophota bacterium]
MKKYTISVQPTPNPNALKFVLNVPLKARDTAVFKTRKDADAVPLAKAILKLDGVTELYFSGNFLTVTQNGAADWDKLEKEVKDTVLKLMDAHNPDFELSSVKNDSPKPGGELAKINEILDRTIRPALQHDGGDLEILSLEGKTLTISYQGACGCCPHAAMGTLYAIQNILRDQYDSEILIEMA